MRTGFGLRAMRGIASEICWKLWWSGVIVRSVGIIHRGFLLTENETRLSFFVFERSMEVENESCTDGDKQLGWKRTQSQHTHVSTREVKRLEG